MELSYGAGSATDIASSSPLNITDLLPVFQSYSLLMGKLRFDAAREVIESFRGKRIPVTTSAEDSACHSLLSASVQLSQLEKTYFSLNFMLPKAFFRKENNLLSSYGHLKNDLCRLMETDSVHVQSCSAEDLRRRFIDIVSSRTSLVNVYNAFNIYNLGLPNEICGLIDVLSSVNDLLSASRKHECLSAFVELLVSEVAVLKLLLEAHLSIIRCEFLPSLLKLKDARDCMRQWFNVIEYVKSRAKTSTSFFRLSSSSRSSTLQLCEWLDHFYSLLVSKFSLYFHDSLSPQCSTSDMDHAIAALKAPNFVQIFTSFARKYDTLFLALIVNRSSSTDVSNAIGYACNKRQNLYEGELRSKFPVLFRMGDERNDFDFLFPSLSILIQQSAETGQPPDRIKYCYDQHLSKSIFVASVECNIYLAIVFARKVAERDSSVINFLTDNCARLRCAKACHALRGSAK